MSVNVSSALMLAQQLSSLTSRAALFGDMMDVIFVTHLVERLTRLVDHVRELCKLLEAEFPKMRSLTGGWLLYKAPDLIGEIEKHLFEHRGHQRGKSPIYSLSNLEKGFFRTAGEVFSVSLAQGGPAPRFLRPWCFDYLSSGDLDESTLTIDDVDDAELYNLIKKVEEEETDLSAWNDQIINCGFTGAIKPENKEAIIRSIVLHATLRLLPLLKQIRKGFEVYNFVDILENHSGLCQQFFVPGVVDDDDDDKIGDSDVNYAAVSFASAPPARRSNNRHLSEYSEVNYKLRDHML
ncbi:G2 M phase-specific E3 ubiquitin- ligase-like protein [Labeo rohita]|uniref:G2 M phase-specific E3 ubiquitin-ligase-like protein n=1 Tax=Labeo rohita TaxID=84645 RepID=A0A498NM28_LABRO|nr:G2 M phase-specific E3 ubiquitin- ligase-like protein [Labeo rohita]